MIDIVELRKRLFYRVDITLEVQTVEELLNRLEEAEKELVEIRHGAAVANDTIKALQAKIEAMERQEPVFWWRPCSDGTYEGPLHNNSIERVRKLSGAWSPLYALPGAQPAPSVPECPYPCGWQHLLKYALVDGSFLARSINEDELVTENGRAVTMRMVMRLRDVLMAINNAASEAKS